MGPMTREMFIQELNARIPRIRALITNVGMLEARRLIIGAVPDSYFVEKRELVAWWDRTFSEVN